MTPLPENYIQLLKDYATLITTLHTRVQSIVSIKPVEQYGVKIDFVAETISEQIKKWPRNVLVLPPSAWVEPRKGKIKHNDNEEWEFAFHGAGLSFRNIQNGQDVSLEYTRNGNWGITNYTFMMYLKTHNERGVDTLTLLDAHSKHFDELVSQGYLVKADPLFIQDDQTFMLGHNKNKY